MDILNNIISMPQSGSANAQKAQGGRASAEKIFGFLKLLSGDKGKAAEGEGLAAKLSRLLENNPEKAAELQKILGNASPGTKDDVIKQIMALLGEGSGSKPAITSDLASGLFLFLQGATDEGTILQALEDQFAALGGELTPESIEGFRQDAIEYMKSLGLSDSDIEGYLVKFTLAHGDAIAQEQAAELMMPLPEQKTPPPKLIAQPQAEQQLQAAVHNAKGEDAPDTGVAPRQTSSQAPAQTSTSHISLVNSLAAGDGGFTGDGFGNPSFGQQGNNGFGAALNGLTAAGAATPESFVNHMTASGQTQTTQMIALQIQRNAQAQVNTFNMQLHPADLGRLEVRLRFMRDGTMKAHITADRADTLSLLQKDAQQLHRILEQAGLSMDENALSFDLRQQQHEGTHQSYNENGAADADGSETATDNALQAKIAVETAGIVRQGGVNIMV